MTNNGLRHRDAISFVIALAMLGACGGSDSSSAEPAGPDASSEQSQQDDVADGSEADAQPSTGEGGASITINGTVHQFAPEDIAFCLLDENGIFRGAATSADYSQTLEFSLPPEGFTTDDPLSAADVYATVSFAQSESEIWLASAYESDPLSVNNRNIPAGQTQVDSYDFSSAGASGSATFLNTQALTVTDGVFNGEPVSGTFEISCN